MDGEIYLVAAPDANMVKIGWTTNLRQRMSALQTGCPERLLLIGSVPGRQYQEREIHKLFAPLRARGEWFRYTDEIDRYFAYISCDSEEEWADYCRSEGLT